MSDWSYFAGIVDGEGSLMIGRVFSNYTLHINYQGRLGITTTSEALKDFLIKEYPGLTCNNKHLTGKHNVPAYTINGGEKWLDENLKNFADKLVIKKTQAQLITDLIYQKIEGGMEQYKLFEFFKQKIHDLNGRGDDKYKKEFRKGLEEKRIAKHLKQLEFVKEKKALMDARECLECKKKLKGRGYAAKFCSNRCKAADAYRRKKGGEIAPSPQSDVEIPVRLDRPSS